MTHNNKHTILINKTKFTPYCVPPAHAPASVRLSKLKTDTQLLAGSKTYEKREVIFFRRFLRPDHRWNRFAHVSSGMQLWYLLTGNVCGPRGAHNSKKRICNVRTKSLWYVEIVVCRLYDFLIGQSSGNQILAYRSSGEAHKMGSQHGFHSDRQ